MSSITSPSTPTKTKVGVNLMKADLKKRMEQSPQNVEFNGAEREYAANMMSKLVTMRDIHESTHEEFDDMNILDYTEMNARRMQNYTPPRKNRSDSRITSGLSREKALAIAAHIHRLNLSPEIHAYDKDSNKDFQLSRTMTNAVRKSRELEFDEEKRLLRAMTLIEEGTCVVEEAWVPNTKTYKKILNKKKLDPATGFAGLKWIERSETLYRAESNIISIKDVLFSNVSTYDGTGAKQNLIATVERHPIESVVGMFQNWKNFKYVKPGESGQTFIDMVRKFRDLTLYDNEEGVVEIIKVQDLVNDEYQIIMNGVFMLPMGFPTPWEWEGSSLSWQAFEPISPNFIYGKSLMSKLDTDDGLLTAMLRMFVQKTAQSVKPPTANRTKRKLPPNVFDAGMMWNDINPDQLTPLIDHNGVTAAEWQMFEKIREMIDSKSVSRIAQGQQLAKSATATEILQLQRQAEISIGLALFAAQNLEKKMVDKRTPNILYHWSQPESVRYDEGTKKTVRTYGSVMVDNVNFGDVEGSEKIMFTDEDFTPQRKQELSRQMLKDEEASTTNVRTTIISKPILERLKYSFKTVINPVEKDSDQMNKILFNEKFTQAANFFGLQSLNLESWKSDFARSWEGDPFKMFNNFGQAQVEQLAQQVPEEEGQQKLPSTKTQQGREGAKSQVVPQAQNVLKQLQGKQ